MNIIFKSSCLLKNKVTHYKTLKCPSYLTGYKGIAAEYIAHLYYQQVLMHHLITYFLIFKVIIFKQNYEKWGKKTYNSITQRKNYEKLVMT